MGSEDDAAEAVGGNDLDLVGYAEVRQRLRGVAHDAPVGVRAHDDTDERGGGTVERSGHRTRLGCMAGDCPERHPRRENP